MLTVALSGFVLIGRDIRADVAQLDSKQETIAEHQAHHHQIHIDQVPRLERIENKVDALGRTGGGANLEPILEQLNRMEKQQLQQDREIRSIRQYLSPRRNQ